MDNGNPIASGNAPFDGDKKPYTAAFSQPITSPQGMDAQQMAGTMQAAQPIASGPNPVGQNPVTGAPIMSQNVAPEPMPKRRDVMSLVKTIAIITLSLLSLTFIGLFIWMFVQYDEKRTDVDGQIAEAVVEAVDANTTKLENEFTEREKYPFKTFAGPADYGELTFEYPKTWSVYVAKDASAGGDFEAYFNPVEVNVVSETTIDSLRLIIKDDAFDNVAAEYQDALEADPPTLKLDSITIGQENNIPASRYTGLIPGTEFNGYIVLFKIRDKTVIMQTDSVLFEEDYVKILASVRFNA